MCNVKMNPEHNGIELYFDEKPSATIRTQMKSEGFRWHGVKKFWYAKQTPSRLKLAAKLSGEKVATKSETTTATKVETATVSKYGLKPGDILSAIWGYSMTIVEYYKVVSIPSPSKVELVELAHNAVKGSEDRGGGMNVMPDTEREIGDHIIKQIVKGRGEYGPAWYVKINDSCLHNRWLGNNPEAVPFMYQYLKKHGFKFEEWMLLNKGTGYSAGKEQLDASFLTKTA